MYSKIFLKIYDYRLCKTLYQIVKQKYFYRIQKIMIENITYK